LKTFQFKYDSPGQPAIVDFKELLGFLAGAGLLAILIILYIFAGGMTGGGM